MKGYEFQIGQGSGDPDQTLAITLWNLSECSVKETSLFRMVG